MGQVEKFLKKFLKRLFVAILHASASRREIDLRQTEPTDPRLQPCLVALQQNWLRGLLPPSWLPPERQLTALLLPEQA